MITATDLFAGAGGSTTGATLAGARVVVAANHWPLAVETHAANHPDTEHDCADISQVEPRRYPRTDLLLASPECTWHSPASGRKRDPHQGDLFNHRPLPPEAGQRSRATIAEPDSDVVDVETGEIFDPETSEMFDGTMFGGDQS